MSQRTRYFLIGSSLVVVLGLGVGLVAYYGGGLPLRSRVGPAEFAYIPADATAVAYANVRAIMDSQFTQKLRQVLPTGEEKAKLHAELGLDVERDIDSVVVGAVGTEPTEAGVVLVRGRFNDVQIETIAVQHGGTAQQYKGKRMVLLNGHRHPVVTRESGDANVAPSDRVAALAFLEPGLVAFGDLSAIQRAIDTSTTHQDVTKNADLMKLVGEIPTGSDAWVVGNFEAVSKSETVPQEVRRHLPAVQWFAVSANVNGGLNGLVRAEARDEKSGEELRAVVNGALAAGRLVSGQDTRIELMLNSLQVTGTGKSVSLSFTVPPELLDLINGFAAMKHMGEGGAKR